MLKSRSLVVLLAIPVLFYGCSQYVNKQVQQSAQDMLDGDTTHEDKQARKEKQKMLDEIYARPVRGGVSNNINDIVLKFIQTGTSKDDASRILQNQGIKRVDESFGLSVARDEREKGHEFFPIMKHMEIRLLFNSNQQLIDMQSYLFLDSL